MQDSFVENQLVADSSIDTFSLAWAEFENVIGKNYLDVLNQATVVDSDFDFDKAFDQVKANQVVRIVYDKNENTLAKLSNLYSALNMSHSSVFVLLQNQGSNTNFYVGVRHCRGERSLSISNCKLAQIFTQYFNLKWQYQIFLNKFRRSRTCDRPLCRGRR